MHLYTKYKIFNNQQHPPDLFSFSFNAFPSFNLIFFLSVSFLTFEEFNFYIILLAISLNA